MTDHSTEEAAAQRRKTERSARMVLAKHPCVVGGGVLPAKQAGEAAVPAPGETDGLRIARGLR